MFRRGLGIALAIIFSGTAAAQTSRAPLGERVDPAAMGIGHSELNPLLNLPPNYRLISAFGERPVFSPDGSKIAFIGKSYGDAFELDLRTGVVRNLTAHAPSNGFLRVHYLPDGSYLLLGPRVPGATADETRFSTIELFWMDAAAKRPPVPLHRTLFEGVAVAHQGNLIAWSEVTPRASTFAGMKTTRIMTGRVVVSGGSASIQQEKNVLTLDAATQCLAEPQDFYPGDTRITLPCDPDVTKLPDGRLSDVMSLDLNTSELTLSPTPAALYGEVEGMFPDGKRTLVECSANKSSAMDICVLELRKDDPSYTRLTHVMDYGRWKFGNPVVSPNGRKIALQVAAIPGAEQIADRGAGQGIIIIDLPPYRWRRESGAAAGGPALPRYR